ncbi:MAG TPA: tetratricopeptide repeat protein [Planctomycetota bacterium]
MQNGSKRVLLYGAASFVLSGIGIVWARHEAEADIDTLLSGAEVQLKMAYVMPATDKQGKPIDARETLIAEAEANLAKVERQQPGMAVTIEFQGFARMLRGKYAEAADSYHRAQSCSDCQAEQRDVLAFNEARMLARAGFRERALEVFRAHQKALDQRFAHQRSIEEAAILRELGRRVESEQLLDAMLRGASDEPAAWLQAGLEYEQLGNVDKAARALEKAAAEVPIADYHRARLKLRQGEFDRCIELLERAAKALPAEVRQRVREEAGAWSAIAKDWRFQRLSAPPAATPGR